MSIEDLMKPRYKVIARYPLALFPVGEILHPKNPHNFNVVEGGYWITDLDKYPHLFSPLEWWDEREEKDLPEYVKTKAGNSVRRLLFIRWGQVYFAEHKHRNCKHWLPATAEEYEQYINKKQI